MSRTAKHNLQLIVFPWRVCAKVETLHEINEVTHRSGLPPRCLYAILTLAQSCSKK